MKLEGVPKSLRDRLGEDATAGLVELFNKQQDVMTDAIVRAIVRELEPRFAAIGPAVIRELEPRFAAIERRLDLCATKDDLRAFATKDDLRAFARKEDLWAFATKDDLRAMKWQLVAWMLAFCAAQAVATVTYIRLFV